MHTLKAIAIAVVILGSLVAGYALQEETGICLPERHAADQQNAKFCHCVDMGGYRFCKDGAWQYKDWIGSGTPTPQCEMSCKEEFCNCCRWQNDYDKTHGKRITIPYDPVTP